MRIVSLLPAATEIVYALGLGDQLVGRSHRCDYPHEAMSVPALTLDRPIGSPEPRLRREALAEARADLILADGSEDDPVVEYTEVSAIVGRMQEECTLVALGAQSIEGILNSVATVGAFAEAEDEAVGLVELLRERLSVLENSILERRLQGVASRRVVVLDSLDPLMAAGRWVPEMVRRAGGWELLGRDGELPTPTSWERIREVEPEVVVLALRDRDAIGAVRALEASDLPSWFDELDAVRDGELFAVDGSGLFARPGPRVIEGIAVLAELSDPEAFAGSGPSESWIPLGPIGIAAAADD